MWEGLRNSECSAISCYLLSSKLLFLLILFCCTESYKLVLGEHVQEAAKPSWVFGLKSLGSHLWQPSHRTMPPCTPLVASIQYPGLLGSSAAQCCRCGSQSRDTHSLGEDTAAHLSSLVQQVVTASLVLYSVAGCFQSCGTLLCLAEFLFVNVCFWKRLI